MGDCPGWSGWAQCNQKGLSKEVGKRVREEGEGCDGGGCSDML